MTESPYEDWGKEVGEFLEGIPKNMPIQELVDGLMVAVYNQAIEDAKEQMRIDRYHTYNDKYRHLGALKKVSE